MARCNDTYFNKVSKSKYDKNTEVTINVLSDLPDCKRINAKDFATASNATTFSKFIKPDNDFECYRQGCVNSGTLDVPADTTLIYKVAYDATEFAAGVITFYVKPTEDDTLTVSISTDAVAKNADVYKVAIDKNAVLEDGYIPVAVDLSKTPDEVVGTGWDASETGAYLTFHSDKEYGLSSINILDSVEDFEINDVVKISCISEITNDITADIAEETCVTNGYDQTSAPTIEITITGKLLTANHWLLNPMADKGETVDGFTIATAKKTVVEKDGYGVITIPDALLSECGFIGVQANDSCNATEATLTRLSTPYLTTVDEAHFIVIKDTANEIAYVYVSKTFVGQEMLVSYPQKAEIEEHVTSFNNLGKRRCRISYPMSVSDGTEYNVVLSNCLVTSFPLGISSDENDFEITFSVQPDADGAYLHEYRIVR